MNSQQPTEQGLARRSADGLVLSSPAEYAAYLQQQVAAHAHILSPVTAIGALPENWVFVPSMVYLSANEAEGDVYRDALSCKPDEVMPTKIGLRKIAKAAGISWTVSREDSGHVPHYWAMKCTLTYRGHDGLPKSVEAAYEWDLRDDSARLKKFKEGKEGRMSAPELNRARLNGYRRCEAGAINAAIREYGLKQKYTRDELKRPFVVFNLVFKPTNEAQANMLAQAALTNTNLLYGGAGTAALPAADATKTPVDTFTGEVIEQDKPKAPAVEKPFEDDPPAQAKKPQGMLVTGVTQSGDDYYVVVENGQKLHTTDRGIAKACNEARKTSARINIQAERRGDVIEILEVGGEEY